MTSGVLAAMFVAFLLGFAFGISLEGRRWRDKAQTGFRCESRGRLYVVEEWRHDAGALRDDAAPAVISHFGSFG